MGKRLKELSREHRDFVAAQKIFFIASAAGDGRVNVSPKATDELRIIDASTVAYRDLTGSGNETAAHVLAGGGVTFMFCAFSGPPKILRLYGHARVLPIGSAEYDALWRAHFNGEARVGARQIVVLSVELVQASCGYAVPQFDFVAPRTALDRWAKAKGKAGVETYQREHNVRSLDGLPTGIVDDIERARTR